MHAQASKRGKDGERAERRGKVDAEAVRKRTMARMEQGAAFRIVGELKTIQKEMKAGDASRPSRASRMSSDGGGTDDGDDEDASGAGGAGQEAAAWLRALKTAAWDFFRHNFRATKRLLDQVQGRTYYPPYKAWDRVFRTLRIEADAVNALYDVFADIDIDHSGEITMFEFLMFFDMEKSLFMTRFFELMDTSHNGGIDFIEFVVAMWNFCTLTPRALACEPRRRAARDAPRLRARVVVSRARGHDAEGPSLVSAPRPPFRSFHTRQVPRVRRLLPAPDRRGARPVPGRRDRPVLAEGRAPVRRRRDQGAARHALRRVLEDERAGVRARQQPAALRAREPAHPHSEGVLRVLPAQPAHALPRVRAADDDPRDGVRRQLVARADRRAHARGRGHQRPAHRVPHAALEQARRRAGARRSAAPRSPPRARALSGRTLEPRDSPPLSSRALPGQAGQPRAEGGAGAAQLVGDREPRRVGRRRLHAQGGQAVAAQGQRREQRARRGRRAGGGRRRRRRRRGRRRRRADAAARGRRSASPSSPVCRTRSTCCPARSSARRAAASCRPRRRRRRRRGARAAARPLSASGRFTDRRPPRAPAPAASPEKKAQLGELRLVGANALGHHLSAAEAQRAAERAAAA